MPSPEAMDNELENEFVEEYGESGVDTDELGETLRTASPLLKSICNMLHYLADPMLSTRVSDKERKLMSKLLEKSMELIGTMDEQIEALDAEQE